MKYKKYPSYKDSGVEWLGEIPSEWNESRLKFIGYTYGGLSGKAGKDFGDEENLESKRFIPFTNIANNAFIKSDNLGYVIINEKEEQNKVKINDLFFLMSSENYDDLGKASLLEENLKDTYLNSFCKGFRLTDKLINPRFLNYLLSGNIYRKLLSIQGNGFTRINLRLEKLNELQLLLPHFQEQQQIANFLDKAIAKIDILIEKQTKQIELLKEKRQAVISHAVTKGINPNVPMKDSGVEWLGEIPEHWEIPKLIYISSRIGDGLHSTPLYEDNTGFYFINGNNLINGNIFFKNTSKEVSELEYVKHFIRLDSNSLLVSINGTIGNVALYNDEKIILGKSAAYINCLIKINREFLMFYLQSNCAKRYYDIEVTGTTIFNLSLNSIRKMSVALPPYLEQLEIIRYCKEMQFKYNTLIQKTNKSIELLKEKRTALISACVTGKIDVRELV